jgi:3-hydroxyacyl-[acyl-carrier-protein] dehydratase
MTVAACGAVDGAVTVLDRGAPGERPARCEVVVGAEEKVFAGHFPGFPLFPGVCVVECVQRGALTTLPEPGGRWALAAIESARFLSPVFPGSTLSCEFVWSWKDESWRCRASAHTGGGPVARIRLRFGRREAVE